MGSQETAHPTRYWRRGGDRIVCELCPRECALQEGQRGLCFVRKRQSNAVVLTTYGRSSGFCVDPIEKKPLNHFLPGTPVLSFGTAGCNLACRFCQNWSISKSRAVDTLADRASPDDLAEAALEEGCRSVAFTYNDPVIFLEYAVDTARACAERGLKNVAVTAGYVQEEPRREFFSVMDAVNVDLKAFTEDFYSGFCGGELGVVLDTLRYLVHETSCWVEITTLLIPGANDDPQEIERLSRWVVRELGTHVPLHFSAFHPDWKMKDRPRTPVETLRMARSIARSEGLDFVYTGNVYDPDGDRTACPSCSAPLIERDRYRILSWTMAENGSCGHCGLRIPGVFEAAPGSWGARRKPVQLTVL